MPKGDALAVARIAGIQAAKRTPDLVPLCHPIAIHGVEVDLVVEDDAVAITATVRTADRTGVEMEALTCVAVAALALIDMVKAVDPAAVITDVRVEEKTGGSQRTLGARAVTGRWSSRVSTRAAPGCTRTVRAGAASTGWPRWASRSTGRWSCRTASRSRRACARPSAATTSSSPPAAPA